MVQQTPPPSGPSKIPPVGDSSGVNEHLAASLNDFWTTMMLATGQDLKHPTYSNLQIKSAFGDKIVVAALQDLMTTCDKYSMSIPADIAKDLQTCFGTPFPQPSEITVGYIQDNFPKLQELFGQSYAHDKSLIGSQTSSLGQPDVVTKLIQSIEDNLPKGAGAGTIQAAIINCWSTLTPGYDFNNPLGPFLSTQPLSGYARAFLICLDTPLGLQSDPTATLASTAVTGPVALFQEALQSTNIAQLFNANNLGELKALINGQG